MPRGRRLERLRFRLLVVDALRSAKSRYSYRELSEATGVDPTLLARYVAGSMIPSYEHAERIWAGLRRLVDPARAILSSIRRYGGLIDLTDFLSDPVMLRVAALEFLERFSGEEVTRILVPEASGIPLATSLSLHFNAGLVIARRRKENPLEDYIEGHLVESPRVSRIFYVPRRSLGRGENVLIVDDIVQTGYTLSVMERIVEAASARLVGVAALVVIGEEWRRRLKARRVEALLSISGRPLFE